MPTACPLDSLGRRRSPAAVPGYLAGRPPRNKGLRYPPDPPRTEFGLAPAKCPKHRRAAHSGLARAAGSVLAIRLDPHATIEQLEWTVNAYNVIFAVLLITGAALGDRFGRRRLTPCTTRSPSPSSRDTRRLRRPLGRSTMGLLPIAGGAGYVRGMVDVASPLRRGRGTSAVG